MLAVLLGKIGDFLMKRVFVVLKKKAVKALIRIVDNSVMPNLKIKSRQLGRDFSAELRQAAVKNKLGEKTAQDVEGYVEELFQAFWVGANEDDS